MDDEETLRRVDSPNKPADHQMVPYDPQVAKKMLARSQSFATMNNAYHEALNRGRHPRSFPHRTKIWDMVNNAKERVRLVQSGRRLGSVLGVNVNQAMEIKGGGKAKKSINIKKEISHQKALNHSASAPTTLQHNREPDAISLAKSYTANYEDSNARTQKISRRLSDFRKAKNSSMQIGRRRNTLNRRQSAKYGSMKSQSTNSGTPLRSIRETKGMNGASPSSNVNGSGTNNNGANEDVVEAEQFIRDARMKGYRRNKGSVFRFIELSSLQEAQKEGPGKRQSTKAQALASNATRTSTKKRTKIVNKFASDKEDGEEVDPSKILSFSDLRDKNKVVADIDIVEFTPINAEGKLFYGMQIALEYHDGSFLTVAEPYGNISFMKHPRRASELNKDDSEDEDDPASNLESVPAVCVDQQYTILFTLVNLNDPEYVGPICSGDDVWLAIRPGNGQYSWKNGSILGTRVTGGAGIETVPISKAIPSGLISEERERALMVPRNGPTGDFHDPSHDSGQKTDNEDKNGKSGLDRATIANRNGENGGDGSEKRIGSADSNSGKNGNKNTNGGLFAQQDSIGTVLPILTYLPKLPGQDGKAEKSLDDLYRDATNVQRIQRLNKTSSHLGQWNICCADNQRIKKFKTQQKNSSAVDGGNSESSSKLEKNLQLTNDMPVYLEQDWVYLAATEMEYSALHNVPLHKRDALSLEAIQTMDASLKKTPKKRSRGPYRIERQGLLRIRLVQQKLDLKNDQNKFRKTVEQTLIRARMQLKTSEVGRNGKKEYLPGLTSGASFPKQMRRIRQNVENKLDSTYLVPLEKLEHTMPEYFFDRFRSIAPFEEEEEEERFMQAKQAEARPRFHQSTRLLTNIPVSPTNANSLKQSKFQTNQKATDCINTNNVLASGGNSTNNTTTPSNPKIDKKKIIHELGKELEQEIMYRNSEAYQKRLAEPGLTPWYDTVFNMKLQDQSMLKEIYEPAKGKARFKAATLSLLNSAAANAFTDLGIAEKRKRDRELCMKKPIYQKLVEEDAKIKRFVDAKKYGSNNVKGQQHHHAS